MNHLGGRRRSIIAQQLAASKEEKHEEKVPDQARQEGPVLKGPKLCPKCGKVPGYFFHTKNCKG